VSWEPKTNSKQTQNELDFERKKRESKREMGLRMPNSEAGKGKLAMRI
jgi:hypothetical protein